MAAPHEHQHEHQEHAAFTGDWWEEYYRAAGTRIRQVRRADAQVTMRDVVVKARRA